MTAAQVSERLNAAVDGWFTASEANAAGRAGLFRIMFSAFYLWHLSPHFAASLSGVSLDGHYRILLIEWVPEGLPPACFELLESTLVAALVMLLLGFHGRLATAVVLVVGGALEAFYAGVDPELGAVFLAFYLPLFMLLSDRWGHTYSFDALLRQRAGAPRINASNSAWPYFLAARAVLVVLSLLFCSAAAAKVFGAGTWLDHPRLMADLMLNESVSAVKAGLPANPVAPWFSETPLAYNAMRYGVVLFEATFPLALVSRKLRNFYVALALLFHSLGAIWLMVTFTPILIVYALFVDWQALRARLWPKGVVILDAVSSRFLIWSALSLAVMGGILWNVGEGLRTALNFGGLVNWHTIWYPVLPVSLVWCVLALIDLIRSATTGGRRPVPRPPRARTSP